MPSVERGVTHQNVNEFEADRFLPGDGSLHPLVSGGLKGFMKVALGTAPGNIEEEAVRALVGEVADYEQALPIYKAHPFRYASVPRIPDVYEAYSAQDTVASALRNMRFMRERFGDDVFAATNYVRRRERLKSWDVPIDEDYRLRIRGGSGAGTFSVDIGLGVVEERDGRPPKYKELWRAGVDTVQEGETTSARFIRTGSGTKSGDIAKQQTFTEFRRRHRIMPQRLLGLVGLYFMRELEPDHALALTTQGALRLSTMGRSRSRCDYTGIFTNIGFEPSDDPNWLIIPEFTDGFYEALERSDIMKHEAHRLHVAVEGINGLSLDTASPTYGGSPSFRLCTDERTRTIERELAIAMPPVEAEATQ